MLNGIFLFLLVGAVTYAAFFGSMPDVNRAGLESAKSAVTLAIGLIGQMALWLGFMRVLRDGGLMNSISRVLHPVAKRLFPDIPAEHPALGAMIMNIAANMLGLGNAATPFGLKAMKELNRLSRRRGVATDSMVLFLAINTSGVAVLPLGVIAVRAQLGASNIAGIVLPSIFATMCSTIVAITIAKALSRMPRFSVENYPADEPETNAAEDESIKGLDEAESIAEHRVTRDPIRGWMLPVFVVVIAFAIFRHLQTSGEASAFDTVKNVLSDWLLPLLMAGIVLFGFGRRVKVYESFVAGAKEGFEIAVLIIPYLVAILVSIGMFRASGLLGLLVSGLEPITSLVGFPAEALPMALIRPLSGSGALGVMTEIMTTNGPDSFVGFLVSVMNGSTETTFYVLALYFGSVQVRAARHTVIACLAADFTGVVAALIFARIFF